MTTKMKPTEEWFDKPLFSRIACVLYPGNVDQSVRDQMQKIADAEGKKSPQQVARERGR
jgi:hypothetical protein